MRQRITVTRVSNGWTVDYKDPITIIDTSTKVFLDWQEMVEFISSQVDGNEPGRIKEELMADLSQSCPDCKECGLTPQEIFEHANRGCTKPIMPMDLETKYPDWTCHECATKAKGKMPAHHCATFHMGHCDVCGLWKDITQPRDYGHPKYILYFGDEKRKT